MKAQAESCNRFGRVECTEDLDPSESRRGAQRFTAQDSLLEVG